MEGFLAHGGLSVETEGSEEVQIDSMLGSRGTVQSLPLNFGSVTLGVLKSAK